MSTEPEASASGQTSSREVTAKEASKSKGGASSEKPSAHTSSTDAEGFGSGAAQLDRVLDSRTFGAYHVTLPTFEGPLDLLLHLIQQHELDIRDIPMRFISEKYVEYIMMMQEINIDLASEYLVMAATLAHIKSKMLLPKPPVDQDDEAIDEMDPRSELVRRLLEYQKYKNAAEQLGTSPVLGRDVFLRGAPAPMVDGPSPLAQVSVFKLFDAFQKLLSRIVEHADHLIDVDRISISERIIELTDLLRGRGPVRFSDLFSESMTRSDLIVTFLAILEMARLRMMAVLQPAPLAEIEVELTLAPEHDDMITRTDDGAHNADGSHGLADSPADGPSEQDAEQESDTTT